MTGSELASGATPGIIRAGTELRAVPLVPEIRLRQASEPISLWQRTEQLAGRADLDPPFWAFAWAGGQALAGYLLDHPELARGRHVIEIASGSGPVAIAAAKAGAATITAYDIDPVAAAAIGLNAVANGVTVQAVCADILDEDAMPAPGTGLVLVADAFYTRDLAARTMRFLERRRPGGTRRHRHQAHDRLGTPLATKPRKQQRATPWPSTRVTTSRRLASPVSRSPAPRTLRCRP